MRRAQRASKWRCARCWLLRRHTGDLLLQQWLPTLLQRTDDHSLPARWYLEQPQQDTPMHRWEADEEGEWFRAMWGSSRGAEHDWAVGRKRWLIRIWKLWTVMDSDLGIFDSCIRAVLKTEKVKVRCRSFRISHTFARCYTVIGGFIESVLQSQKNTSYFFITKTLTCWVVIRRMDERENNSREKICSWH